MKTILVIVSILISSMAFGYDVQVNGYYRKNGTYVQPHMRTAPDNTLMNNYSTQGNTNPYTGQPGTVNPYGSQNSGYGTQPYQQRKRNSYGW